MKFIRVDGVFKSTYHLPELAVRTGQSVTRMRHFEGMVLQNL